ncbi:hypothetical protein F503_00302 [Ophiostoma piceae UAMH 11346]|uniref:Uncharacterized protein n=1 Tax=Ophiostoma piceae (strain UAMH 11346) TaxID=1262450 RepID=S3D2Q7_OPHP1|nr:hypothetical protein F503_00302 [Ophiostoma piceae UAMH 11346]
MATLMFKPLPVFEEIPFTFEPEIADLVGENGYEFKTRSWFEMWQYEELAPQVKIQLKAKASAAAKNNESKKRIAEQLQREQQRVEEKKSEEEENAGEEEAKPVKSKKAIKRTKDKARQREKKRQAKQAAQAELAGNATLDSDATTLCSTGSDSETNAVGKDKTAKGPAAPVSSTGALLLECSA